MYPLAHKHAVDFSSTTLAAQPLNQAIHWNNEGAVLLRLGRLRAATIVLQKAINILMPSTFNPEYDELRLAFTAAVAFSSSPSIRDVSWLLDEQSWSCRDGRTYIYDRPMLLSTSGIQLTSMAQHKNILRTVGTHTIFNLALAHHLCGRLSRTERTEETSERAMKLYYIVLTETSDAVRSSAMLQYLALNNLSDLHDVFCEYEYSKFCMDSVFDIVHRTKCFNNREVLDDREIYAIALNHALSRLPKSAQAA
jgi:hypothetical protein